jgi:superfamily II DNA or RNA helicase
MIHRVRVPRVIREELFLRSCGHCEQCGAVITIETFHAAHLRAVASGGATVLDNLVAWCARCNWAQGPRDVADTRWSPRGWQLEGLVDPDIPLRIIRQGMATIAAGPGTGKTIFAGLVFETLYDAGIVDRAVIFVPREPLLDQWKQALYRARHLDLTVGQTVERARTLGTINTYQSLTPQSVQNHREQAALARTLVVFDEVHHLGEPVRPGGQRPGWARQAMELVGEIGGFHVTGVLNLSGTLWRSSPGQRISSVHYEPLDGRLLSMVDFTVPAKRLIDEGLLRPVDLYRQGATVELVDFGTSSRFTGDIFDLDEEGPTRAILRELGKDPAWRESFVGAVIDRLQRAYRDLSGAPVKGLIVAATQEAAKEFQETANRLMRTRGLQPFTELAISEDPNASRVLARFRKQQRPGILCTVDMAGEGYDCPDIIVIGYATNKLTALYVRQVVARAQRVTDRERERYGRPLPAAVIVPDVPQLLDYMREILQPIRHETAEEEDPKTPRTTDPSSPSGRRYLVEVTGLREGLAEVTGVPDGEVSMPDVRSLEPHLRALSIAESTAPRILVAARNWARGKREDQPFDPLSTEDQTLVDAGVAPEAPESHVLVESIAESETAAGWQAAWAELERWWKLHGNTPIAEFAGRANAAAGLGRGMRPRASIDELKRGYRWARQEIERHCEATETPLPHLLRETE